MFDLESPLSLGSWGLDLVAPQISILCMLSITRNYLGYDLLVYYLRIAVNMNKL